MKKILLSLLLVILSFPAFADDDKKESAFERVMRTGVVRCGYYVFPPMTYRDPNTNALSGFSIDMMNYLAEQASLKVEWVEEVTFSSWVPALQSKRFDVACTPMWPALSHAKVVSFSDSLFFAGMYPATLEVDNRFNSIKTIHGFDKPEFRFVLLEGNATLNIIKGAVPNATHIILPPETDTGVYYQQLVSKKADLMITDVSSISEYNKKNPESQMKILLKNNPIKLQSFQLAVNGDEIKLRDFLNLGIQEMLYNGKMDHLLRKWESEPGKTFLRVSNPAKVE